jgi:hypothetical protein
MTDGQIVEELNSMLGTFSEHMIPSYQKVRDNYKFKLYNPVYDSLRNEICKCITIGTYQAAMTLTNHLLEKFLKMSLILTHSNVKTLNGIKETVDQFKDANELYLDKNLELTINLACSKGIITKEEKATLKLYKDVFRNGYSHADPNKIFGERTMHLAYGSLTGDKPPEVTTIKIADLPFLQGDAQQQSAQVNVIPYFIFIDGLIQREEIKRYPEIVDYNNRGI